MDGEATPGGGGGHEIPALFPFITLRQERFGALVFNPYLGLEEELSPVHAYCAAMCDGENSRRQVERALRRRFGLSEEAGRLGFEETLSRLQAAMAVTVGRGEEPTRPRLPDMPVFPEDGPYLKAPRDVIWDVTYACNLRCPHCLTSSGTPGPRELDTEAALAVVARLGEAQVLSVSLSGGEPLLRPDILTIIRAICDTDMRVDLATNGVALPATFLAEVGDLPLFQVQVSIDGIGQEHDAFRGLEGAFARACASVRTLREAGLMVALSTTVTAQNVHSLDQIIDLALELDCRGFKAIPFLPAGNGAGNSHRFKLTPRHQRRFGETIARRSEQHQGVLNIATETCFSFLLQPPTHPGCEDGPMGCSAGYDTLSIGSDGVAYPCPFLRAFPLGNLLETPLTHLWHEAPTLNTLRTMQKRDLGEPCSSCAYAPHQCRGGCRAAAYLEHGDLKAADPSCFHQA